MSSLTSDHAAETNLTSPPSACGGEVARLRDLSPQQWKSGIAAWLGWLFDGLDMHLYTIVAVPFVAQLMHSTRADPQVNEKSSWIMAAFLVGWALGGGVFGRLGDRLGRSRTLALTILTYAVFTGLSFFAQTWWQLMIFRFVAALGIGGEWAVGSALLAETWPSRWRPWVAAVLQTAVNIGVLMAAGITYLFAGHFGDYQYRAVFLVGILPALIVFWIRKSVPEPHEWVAAKQSRLSGISTGDVPAPAAPTLADLFRFPVRSLTLRTMVVCAGGLTTWWAFMFWINQLLRSLPDLQNWSDTARGHLVSINFFLLILVSIPGNFFAAALANKLGYRRAIAIMFVGFFATMVGTNWAPREHVSLMCWTPFVGFFSGVFGLFTMYLPPLFPTLLRTTGAGFCYNIGRMAAACGVVIFGIFATHLDMRQAMLINSLLLIPTILVALTLPELKDQ